jgi:tyrosyl-tRNA synthetase
MLRYLRRVTGSSEKDDSFWFVQMICPYMQATDVFLLELEICHLGVGQRKVDMQLAA